MLDTRTSLQDDIGQLCAARAALHQRVLGRVAELDASGAWKADGAASTAAWLVAHHGLSQRTAAEWVRVARALETLPELRSRYAAGELSWDQLRAVTRYATADTETELAETAVMSSAGRLEREARRRERVPLDETRRAYHRRHLEYWWDDKQRALHLKGLLPDDMGAVVVQALGRIVNRGPAEPHTGVFENRETRMADALHEMASSMLGADRDPDRATVVVHVDAAVLGGTDGNAEIQDGPMLAAETARRIGCDARLQTVIEDPNRRPLGIGRASRSIPPWLQRQISLRDQGCRFPGCERKHWAHTHHLVHWAHGGRTDLDNLITLCHYHHQLVHEDGWTITGDPNGQVGWITPQGHLYQPTMYVLNPPYRGLIDGLLPPHLQNPAQQTDTS